VEVQLHAFLTSALDGEWSASRPGRFTPTERALGTQWTGGWVGTRDVLNAVVKRKIPSTRRQSNPRTPIVHPVAQIWIKNTHDYFWLRKSYFQDCIIRCAITTLCWSIFYVIFFCTTISFKKNDNVRHKLQEKKGLCRKDKENFRYGLPLPRVMYMCLFSNFVDASRWRWRGKTSPLCVHLMHFVQTKDALFCRTSQVVLPELWRNDTWKFPAPKCEENVTTKSYNSRAYKET
jgi:hypothetical protein